MRLTIVTTPHKVLRTIAEPIQHFDSDNWEQMGQEMLRLIDKIGIGLAANQVGLTKRLIVTAVPGFEPTIMCNPEIVWKKGFAIAEEGCLSEPGIKVKVARATKIRVSYQKTDGTAVEQTFQNHLLARCIQHEIDHINGVLISDYAPKKVAA
jgi:peptide deformylase